MESFTSIADAAAARHRYQLELERHQSQSRKETARLQAAIRCADEAVLLGAAGLDLALVHLAESVLLLGGKYAAGGLDRESVVRDAIAQIATGEKQGYRGLWEERFATKNYAHWTGQRSDAEYGCGPKHGSIVFSIGLCREVRQRDPRELTPAERDACVYYLTNIERIQRERSSVMEAA